MTIELFYLLLVALLTGALWIPVVIGYASSRGPLKPADYIIAPTCAAARLGESRQPGAHECDREHRAVRDRGSDRQCGRRVDIRHGNVRRRFLLRARRACGDPRQRIQPVEGPHHRLHDRLDRVHDVRGGTAAAGGAPEPHARQSRSRGALGVFLLASRRVRADEARDAAANFYHSYARLRAGGLTGDSDGRAGAARAAAHAGTSRSFQCRTA